MLPRSGPKQGCRYRVVAYLQGQIRIFTSFGRKEKLTETKFGTTAAFRMWKTTSKCLEPLNTQIIKWRWGKMHKSSYFSPKIE